MIDEIHIDEERGLLLAELAFDGEETAVERIRADAADRSEHSIAVLRPKRADLDPASVA